MQTDLSQYTRSIQLCKSDTHVHPVPSPTTSPSPFIDQQNTPKCSQVSVSRNPETVLGVWRSDHFVSCIDLAQSRPEPISVLGLGDYWAPSPMLVVPLVPLLQRFHPVAVLQLATGPSTSFVFSSNTSSRHEGLFTEGFRNLRFHQTN